MPDRFDDLRRLMAMRDKGDITDAEYERLKAELLEEDQSSADPPSVASTTADKGTQTRWWLIGTGALMVVGSFLPWAHFGGIFSAAGTAGDGVFTLIAGVAVGLVGIANRVSLFTGIATVVIAGFALWIAGTVFNNLYDPLAAGSGSVGSGVYLTGLASLFALIAGLQLVGEARKEQSAV